MMVLEILIQNLLLTCLMEGSVIGFLYRRKDYIYYSVLCNILTNPALNLIVILIVQLAGDTWYKPSVILLEIVVVWIEAFVYKMLCQFSLKKAFILSLGLNSFSYVAGVIFALL